MEARGMEERDLDSLKATELRLGLPGTEDQPQKLSPAVGRGSKRVLTTKADEERRSKSNYTEAARNTEPPAKAQVVGWPPIRSYRKNCLLGRKAEPEGEAPGSYVKVSMDGAPYLRKIDLGAYRGYRELREALEGMFKCFSLGFLEREGCSSSEYAITYQDKDGDWMLAGDVPWEMFSCSCKRLRIMKGCEARGLDSSP